MNIKVNRLCKTADGLLCAVEVNGRLKYYGLQPAAFQFEGTFPLTKYLSPSHGFDVPLIVGVSGHQGLEIHVGNTVKDTIGCLIIGQNIVSLQFISVSLLAVHEFYTDFFAAIAAGEKCTINFENLFI
ncbi:MAG TPA: DUF5675 family protein [Hanamia sp.]